MQTGSALPVPARGRRWLQLKLAGFQDAWGRVQCEEVWRSYNCFLMQVISWQDLCKQTGRMGGLGLSMGNTQGTPAVY